MQLFSADATILKKKKIAPQNIKNLPSKVAHNPTRPRVFSPASFCFVQLIQFFSLFFFLIFEVVKLCRMNLESPDSTKRDISFQTTYLFTLGIS